MGFSSEWENVYKSGQHQSRWPWSDVVSFTYRYLKPLEGKRILELGCGDGANIPFFQSVCADYYGIEGSKYQVDKLSERFTKKSVAIIAEDFTQSISFGGEFDLILDRGAITCNTTEGILNTMDLIYDKLKLGGVFSGY